MGLCHDLRMRAQLENVGQLFQVSSGWFPSLSILAIAVSILLWLSPTVKPVFLFVLRCYIFHGSRRTRSGRKRIYSSAVVRNRNWRRGHGRIWSNGIIFWIIWIVRGKSVRFDLEDFTSTTCGKTKGELKNIHVYRSFPWSW